MFAIMPPTEYYKEIVIRVHQQGRRPCVIVRILAREYAIHVSGDMVQ